MPTKPKPPAHGAAPRRGRSPASKPEPLPQADGRWRRTVRYGWDKGGARGGRK